MADPDDLVVLILNSLEHVSGSDLSVLSLALADESSLQLQRLWLLLGSTTHSLSIISFLDTLSLRQRRLLLGRLTLRLLRRITDFLSEHAAYKQRTLANVNWRSVSEGHAVGDSRPEAAACSRCATNAEAPGSRTQPRDKIIENEEAPRRLHQLRGSTQDGRERVDQSTFLYPGDSPNGDAGRGREERKVAAEAMETCVSDSLVNIFVHFEKDKSKVLGKVRQSDAGGRSPGRLRVHPERARGLQTFDSEHREGQRGEPFDDSTATSRPGLQEFEYPAGPTKEREVLGVDKVDDRRQPWCDTDAAFVLLFLSETQEQECQEAMRKWCIDPHVYRHFIVRDMAALVDDETKGGLVRAPKWRDSLQDYLLQSILKVGYGVPGMITAANFPASLSAYVDTIGRFQRLLRSVNGEGNHQQKLPLPPASAATLLSLPTIAIGSCKDEKWRLCSICGDEFELATVASQLPCLHVYHWNCILPWLKQRNTCPVCRHELPTDDLDYELQRQKIFLLERAP